MILDLVESASKEDFWMRCGCLPLMVMSCRCVGTSPGLKGGVSLVPWSSWRKHGAGTTKMKMTKGTSHWSEIGSQPLDLCKGGEKQVVSCYRRSQEEAYP